MGKVLVVLAAVAVALLMVAGVVGWLAHPSGQKSHLAVTTESAQVLEQAGTALQRQGGAMVTMGQQSGDFTFVAAGQQWNEYGRTLQQEGRWLVMDPTVPGNLVSSPSISNWTTLVQTSGAMAYEPNRAGTVDIEAVQRAGMAMQSQGENMIEHSRVIEAMMADAEAMGARHGVVLKMNELEDATQRMADLGVQLTDNGNELVEYAQQLRPSPFGVSTAP